MIGVWIGREIESGVGMVSKTEPELKGEEGGEDGGGIKCAVIGGVCDIIIIIKIVITRTSRVINGVTPKMIII